jgi:hypothetical protein
LIRGLGSNLRQQLFHESLMREIEWKQMLMSRMAIVRLCSPFPGHTFVDTKRGWVIEKSPSRLTADYFRPSKSQLALMDGLLSPIDRSG